MIEMIDFKTLGELLLGGFNSIFEGLSGFLNTLNWKQLGDKIVKGINGAIDSLNAEDIVEYRKTGKKWVRFTVRNRFGEQVRVEREVKRMVSIKQHNSSLPAQKRYVVRLGICLGSAYMEEEVSLVNRANFTSQMLVGRSFQAGNVIIDPAQTYLVEPNCQEFLTAEADSKKQIKKKKSKKIEEQAAAEGQVVEEKVISEEIQ